MDANTVMHGNDELGIVSVNERSGTSGMGPRKIVFLVAVGAVIILVLTLALNTWNGARKAKLAEEEAAAKVENKPAQVGPKRVFDSDQVTGIDAHSSRKIVVPGVEDENGVGGPIHLKAGKGTSSATPQPSRFGGEAILPRPHQSSNPQAQPAQFQSQGPTDSLSLVQKMLGNRRDNGSSDPSNGGNSGGAASSLPTDSQLPNRGFGLGPGQSSATNGTGAIGGLLTPSSTPLIQAGKLGDRNLIIPKGKSIDCALTVKIVSSVAGLATCVLTSDVYGDNGRVVLLERGSEAVGEYTAAMAQGQSRLFVLWNRVKTPTGVVVNLNSPAADELGTSGLSGEIDNHWWERLGAGFLLSIVQDAIGFATAQAAGGGGQGQLSIYQHSASTGNRMAELVLQSTINIRPTLYKNQGDRATIFVARDLDFGTVYALHAE